MEPEAVPHRYVDGTWGVVIKLPGATHRFALELDVARLLATRITAAADEAGSRRAAGDLDRVDAEAETRVLSGNPPGPMMQGGGGGLAGGPR